MDTKGILERPVNHRGIHAHPEPAPATKTRPAESVSELLRRGVALIMVQLRISVNQPTGTAGDAAASARFSLRVDATMDLIVLEDRLKAALRHEDQARCDTLQCAK